MSGRPKTVVLLRKMYYRAKQNADRLHGARLTLSRKMSLFNVVDPRCLMDV